MSNQEKGFDKAEIGDGIDHARLLRETMGGLCPIHPPACLRVHGALDKLVTTMQQDAQSDSTPLFKTHILAIQERLKQLNPDAHEFLAGLGACRECVGNCFTKPASLNPKPLANA